MAGRWQLLQMFMLTSVGFFMMKILLYTVHHRTPVAIWKQQEEPGRKYDFMRTDNGSVLMPFWPTPFSPGRPKKVVVMTYQRCGSSFFGQLFNKNRAAFYTYEPLDALYSALYGVREGWNVPSDIGTYPNGTQRRLPDREVAAVSAYLDNLLDCRVDSLPTEALIHRFWFLFRNFHDSLANFTRCLRGNRLVYTRCADFTPAICGARFGEKDEDRLRMCNRMLWDTESRETTHVTDDVIRRNISKYRDCIDAMRPVVDAKCSGIFRQTCEKSELRSTKTVRATMQSMAGLLSGDPNIRVIHLIRDPRAVVLSRRNFDSSARSRYAGGSMVRESEVYCRDVVRDVRLRRELDLKYPGRILPIIYEDLTKQPVKYARKIYEFLNTTIPDDMIQWVSKNTMEKKNSTKIANKWQTTLTYHIVKEITAACSEFFREIDYEFS